MKFFKKSISAIRDFFLLMLLLTIITSASPDQQLLRITNGAIDFKEMTDIIFAISLAALILDVLLLIFTSPVNHPSLFCFIRRTFNIMPNSETYSSSLGIPPLIADRAKFYSDWFGGEIRALSQLKRWKAKYLKRYEHIGGFLDSSELAKYHDIVRELESAIYIKKEKNTL